MGDQRAEIEKEKMKEEQEKKDMQEYERLKKKYGGWNFRILCYGGWNVNVTSVKHEETEEETGREDK